MIRSPLGARAPRLRVIGQPTAAPAALRRLQLLAEIDAAKRFDPFEDYGAAA